MFLSGGNAFQSLPPLNHLRGMIYSRTVSLMTFGSQRISVLFTDMKQIVTNVFVQIVVLLYLIDNNDNTSWMILLGSGMGVIIEAWKVCVSRLGWL